MFNLCLIAVFRKETRNAMRAIDVRREGFEGCETEADVINAIVQRDAIKLNNGISRLTCAKSRHCTAAEVVKVCAQWRT